MNVVLFVDEKTLLEREKIHGLKPRYYFESYTDLGAQAHFPEMKDPRNQLSNVICWLGGWHIEKNYMEGVMKILKVHDIGGLIDIWGWGGIVAHNCMYGVGSKRKTKCFLQVALIPSMFNALLYHYKSTYPLAALQDINEYITNGKTVDTTFADYILLLEILIALDLLLTADVTNNMTMFDAGRIFLLPLNFALNNSSYGPAHVRELIQLYYQMKPEAREDHAKYFTFGGKHFDERMEEQNLAQKRIMSDRTPTEARIKSTGLFVGKCNELEKSLKECLHVKQRGYIPRTHKDCQEEVKKMTKYIVQCGILKVVSGRKEVYTCRKASAAVAIKTERTAFSLKQYGEDGRDSYVNALVTGQDFQFPDPISLED